MFPKSKISVSKVEDHCLQSRRLVSRKSKISVSKVEDFCFQSLNFSGIAFKNANNFPFILVWIIYIEFTFLSCKKYFFASFSFGFSVNFRASNPPKSGICYADKSPVKLFDCNSIVCLSRILKIISGDQMQLVVSIAVEILTACSHRTIAI